MEDKTLSGVSGLRREQHQRRLSHMPWLFHVLKPRHQAWARAWQQQVQQQLMELETVRIGSDCFVAPEAAIFAEPGRDIFIGNRVSIAAYAFLHGPLILGDNVSINARASLDGGVKGIRIGADTRIATNVAIYAFNHQTEPTRRIREQPVTSRGVTIGSDVWIGANACITDGVTIGDGAVVGMGAVVTRDVAPRTVVGGAPARFIRNR
jgi:acetyltransferase-like isoleucine patch superfamily enzyme